MNAVQTRIAIVGACLVALACLVPPWHATNAGGVTVWSPPGMISRISFGPLFVEWVGIAALTAACVFWAGRSGGPPPKLAGYQGNRVRVDGSAERRGPNPLRLNAGVARRRSA